MGLLPRSSGSCQCPALPSWRFHFYTEVVDFRYHSRSHMTLVDCQDSCRRAPQCTGVERPLDGSYCFFWLRGACNAGKAGHVPSGWNIDYDYQTCSWQHHVANYSLASLVFLWTFVCTDEEVHFRIHVDEWPSSIRLEILQPGSLGSKEA